MKTKTSTKEVLLCEVDTVVVGTNFYGKRQIITVFLYVTNNFQPASWAGILFAQQSGA